MLLKNIQTLGFLLILCGCSCKDEELRSFKAISLRDHKLSCKQLREAIIATQHYHNLAEHQLHNPITYSRYPVVCSFSTYAEGKKVSLATQDRLQYLEALYHNKHCADKIAPQPVATIDAPEEKQLQFIEIPATKDTHPKQQTSTK